VKQIFLVSWLAPTNANAGRMPALPEP